MREVLPAARFCEICTSSQSLVFQVFEFNNGQIQNSWYRFKQNAGLPQGKKHFQQQTLCMITDSIGFDTWCNQSKCLNSYISSQHVHFSQIIHFILMYSKGMIKGLKKFCLRYLMHVRRDQRLINVTNV